MPILPLPSLTVNPPLPASARERPPPPTTLDRSERTPAVPAKQRSFPGGLPALPSRRRKPKPGKYARIPAGIPMPTGRR